MDQGFPRRIVTPFGAAERPRQKGDCVRVLLLSTALLCVAACSMSGPPGSGMDVRPPAFAERPPPQLPPGMAAAEPGAPTPLTPAPGQAAAPPPMPLAAAAPPPPPYAPPPAVAEAQPPVMAPAPMVAAPAPAEAATPFAFPFPWVLAGMNPPDPFRRPPPRLTLSNFSYDRAHVEAVVTANSDCDARDAGFYATSQFELTYNGTRVIEVPVGDDVCWRRDLASGEGAGMAAPSWSRWSRAYLSSGRSIELRL